MSLDLYAVLRDALARIVAARSELADGAFTTADMVLEDLEVDLAGMLARLEERRAA